MMNLVMVAANNAPAALNSTHLVRLQFLPVRTIDWKNPTLSHSGIPNSCLGSPNDWSEFDNKIPIVNPVPQAITHRKRKLHFR